MFFRYNLLCDGCNWQFKGFAVPGTVHSKSVKLRKRVASEKTAKQIVFTILAATSVLMNV